MRTDFCILLELDPSTDKEGLSSGEEESHNTCIAISVSLLVSFVVLMHMWQHYERRC